jgi:hypothetical protein
MRLINYGLLALSLVLVTACGKKPEEAATETAPATTAAPAPEATAPAAESAAMPAPAAEGAMPAAPAVDSALKTEPAAVATCPTGCIQMNCPPPSGPVQCCKRTTTGYKACTL